jgi:hypothetical protein
MANPLPAHSRPTHNVFAIATNYRLTAFLVELTTLAMRLVCQIIIADVSLTSNNSSLTKGEAVKIALADCQGETVIARRLQENANRCSQPVRAHR